MLKFSGFTGIKGGDHIVVAQKIVTSQGFEDVSVLRGL